MKILFYYCQTFAADSGLFYFGTADLYLKTQIDLEHTDIADKVSWLTPEYFSLTDSELVQLVEQQQPDVFCTSHYVWNDVMLHDQLRKIKQLFPNIKTVVGGPSVDCHINTDFFHNHPWVDYAIYGPGELAFANLLKSMLGQHTLNSLSTVNTSWVNQTTQRQIVAPYRYQPESAVSPYLHNRERLAYATKMIRSRGFEPSLSYSLTRGCPYSCTFCDWNSGLGNKVSRRRGSYRAEVDLFCELELYSLYLADANVGQYQEDVDMIAYLAEKNVKHGAQFLLQGNFSKLRKENNAKIFKIMGEAGLVRKVFVLSVQDINSEVLKNVDRPDVGWPVHQQMIRDLRAQFPNKVSGIQLIQGLPGQTLETWINTLKTVTKENVALSVFLSELLPASPAAMDKDYQQRWQFEYSNSERINTVGVRFRGNFAASCASYTRHDQCAMSVLSIFFTALSFLNLGLGIDTVRLVDIDAITDQFLESSIYQELTQDLYHNWITNDQFFFTKNIAFEPALVPACAPYEVAYEWLIDKTFLKFLVDAIAPPDRLGFIKQFKMAKDSNTLVPSGLP